MQCPLPGRQAEGKAEVGEGTHHHPEYMRHGPLAHGSHHHITGMHSMPWLLMMLMELNVKVVCSSDQNWVQVCGASVGRKWGAAKQGGRQKGAGGGGAAGWEVQQCRVGRSGVCV